MFSQVSSIWVRRDEDCHSKPSLELVNLMKERWRAPFGQEESNQLQSPPNAFLVFAHIDIPRNLHRPLSLGLTVFNIISSSTRIEKDCPWVFQGSEAAFYLLMLSMEEVLSLT